ncbi:MAG: DUF5615 family PIN-like protein [Pirellulaceae bacterium]
MTRSLRFLADEDFDNDIVRGLLRRLPDLDIVRVQDVQLSGQGDAAVLAWAAAELRILLTHDVSTMTAHAIQRIISRSLMPGLFAVSQSAPLGQVIEDLVLAVECSQDTEWHSQIHYLPFR